MSSTSTAVGLFFIRGVTSLLLVVLHGWSKLSEPERFAGFLASRGIAPDEGPLLKLLTYAAISAETFFPVLVLVGLYTRFAALIVTIHMGVAIVAFHLAKNSDPVEVWEKALLYLVVYAFITIAGPGTLSLDAVFESGKKRRRRGRQRLLG